MKISFLGLTIAIGKEQVEKVDTKTETAELVVLEKTSTERDWVEYYSNNVNRLRPLTKSINWPKPPDDPVSRAVFLHNLLEFDTFVGYGKFNICPIRNLCGEFGILKTQRGEAAHETLSKLHCISFALMEKELVQSIPGLVNEVFTGVSFEKDVTNDSSEAHS